MADNQQITVKQRIEAHFGLSMTILGMTCFLAGFGSLKAILAVANQDIVTHGTYILTQECESKTKQQQPAQSPTLGYAYEKLVAHLLDLLQPRSEWLLKRRALDKWFCDGALVNPETKVELLAYLNSGDQAVRKKAILAYAECSLSILEAFYLVRTIKPDEKPSTFEAYSFSLCVINRRYGSETTKAQLADFMSEIKAPSMLVSGFLREPHCY